MIISGLNSTTPVAYPTSVSRPTTQPDNNDQVAMSISADTFSSFVQEAGQQPEVRSELVDAFKSRIQSGTYPSQDTIDGLIDKMGGTWAQMAGVDSSDS